MMNENCYVKTGMAVVMGMFLLLLLLLLVVVVVVVVVGGGWILGRKPTR